MIAVIGHEGYLG